MLFCAQCSTPLPPKRGRGKPRKFCPHCRPPRTVKAAEQPRKRREPVPLPQLSTLVGAVTAELETAGKLNTSLGQQALSLAERIASDQDSGAAMATMHKELRQIVAAATTNVQADAGDLLDELAARRGKRRGA